MDGAFPHLTFAKESPLKPRRTRNGFGSRVECPNPKAHGQRLLEQVSSSAHLLSTQLGGSCSRNIIQLKLSEKVNFDNISKHGLTLVGQESDQVYLTFANEQQLQEFSGRLENLVDGVQVTYADLLYAIDQVEVWGEADRVSWAIKTHGLPSARSFWLDVELWPLGVLNSQQRKEMLDDFRDWVQLENIKLLDEVNRDSLVLFRVEVAKHQAELFYKHKDVRRVDLPPTTGIEYSKLSIDINSVPSKLPLPLENASKVCILDSGINANHPLLQGAIGDAQSYITGEDESDICGHGTAVAGVALYGNIEERLISSDWSRELYLLSGKILSKGTDGNPIFDTKTIETTLAEAIGYFHEHYGCKIFNLSLGNLNAPYIDGRMSPIAVTIDEIARRLDVLIVISSGNYSGSEAVNNWRNDYPNYLLCDDAAIIDPAPAINALTVGSFAQHTMTFNERRYGAEGEMNQLPVASTGQVSPFSRSSSKPKAALKPELLAHGGNFAITVRPDVPTWQFVDKGLGVLTLNHSPMNNSILSEYTGTSFSAPYITHLAGRLLNNYPEASANLLRALLTNHASLSDEVSMPFKTNKDARRVAGYGVVNEDSLFKSSQESVVLIAEESIEKDKHQFYELPIPSSYFRKGRARRTLSVSLAYSPAVRSTRLEYLATKLRFHVVDAPNLDSVTEAFNNENKAEVKSIPEFGTDKRDITNDVRSRGTVQSSRWEFNQFNKPRKLFLVVTRQDQVWAESQTHDKEKYALVVSLTDRENEDANLYAEISQLLQTKIKPRAKI